MAEIHIQTEIVKLKQKLEDEVKQNNYNFQHPRVIELSQELDKLITLVMRNRWHDTGTN